MEKLYYDVIDKETKNKVNIDEKEHLKTELQHFALRNSRENGKDNLTPDEYAACKSLRAALFYFARGGC